MTEAKFQTFFNKWIKRIYPRTGAYELKQTASGSLPFNALAQHQANALLAVKHRTFTWKIPDLGSYNPFDSFCLDGEAAYVVILFQNTKRFYLIDIDDFLHLAEHSGRKSLTENMAVNAAVVMGKLTNK